jgi:hypothetical protein
MSSSSKDPQKEKERKRLVAENRRIREKQEKQLKEGISKRNTMHRSINLSNACPVDN